MYYRKPHYYHSFSCIADKCPDTCCAGWQILIDEASLEAYSKVQGDFGVRLLNSIDWREGAFEQYEKRCSFLNRDSLCDIYQELGAEALCDTCRRYPRHTEEFENLRELSLSMSCPVAAELILGCKEPVSFYEEEDDKKEAEEEYEDFDVLLFDRLEEARELLFKIARERAWSLEARMLWSLKLSFDFQKALEEGSLYELRLEEKLEKYKEEYRTKDKSKIQKADNRGRYEIMCAMLRDFRKLEVLREDWTERLDKAERLLYKPGADAYSQSRKAFLLQAAEGFWGEAGWDICREQFFVFFIYTYFCGAVYDDMVYTKMVLAVFSTLWLEELMHAKWLEKGSLVFEDFVKAAWQYAREIEHSDENLLLLEEIFDGNLLYSVESLETAMMDEKENGYV